MPAKPLQGKRVLITRSKDQADELAQRIVHFGGEPVLFPVIDTVPVTETDEIERIRLSIRRLSDYDWLIFTSANGVRFFLRHLDEERADRQSLKSLKIASIGNKTAQFLEQHGFHTDIIPQTFHAESLIESLTGHLRAGQTILFPTTDLANETIPAALRLRGVKVDRIHVYHTVIPEHDGVREQLMRQLRNGEIAYATFTSPSTVRHLLQLLNRTIAEDGGDAEDGAGLLRNTVVACIGPKTAGTAAACGLEVSIVPRMANMESLVEEMINYEKRH